MKQTPSAKCPYGPYNCQAILDFEKGLTDYPCDACKITQTNTEEQEGKA